MSGTSNRTGSRSGNMFLIHKQTAYLCILETNIFTQFTAAQNFQELLMAFFHSLEYPSDFLEINVHFISDYFVTINVKKKYRLNGCLF